MPVTHQPSVTIIGKFVGMAAEEARNLGLHGMRQQRSRAIAQNLGQWVRKRPWLGQLDDIILGHGVSLLWWRSGGVEHPHDTPPYPFTPSPTSAHNSKAPAMTQKIAATGIYLKQQHLQMEQFSDCKCAIFDLRKAAMFVSDVVPTEVATIVAKEFAWVDSFFEQAADKSEKKPAVIGAILS